MKRSQLTSIDAANASSSRSPKIGSKAAMRMVEELRIFFARTGTVGEIELYPGVHHGFAFPQRWCHEKPATERHWERLIALYRRRFG